MVGYLGRNLPRSVPGWCRIPFVRGEIGCFLWVIQQSRVVGYCPGVQTLTVKGCVVITPVDMLAVEVANTQTGVWERRDGRWYE